MEKENLETIRVDYLKAGDLLYATEVEVDRSDTFDVDNVWKITDIRACGNLFFLKCTGRGPDSGIYFNYPSAKSHFAIPGETLVQIVRRKS